MGKLVVSEKDKEANEEVAKATVTKLMVMNNPKWRQQVVLADGIIADMPKTSAIKKLIENKCVRGWKFK